MRIFALYKHCAMRLPFHPLIVTTKFTRLRRFFYGLLTCVSKPFYLTSLNKCFANCLIINHMQKPHQQLTHHLLSPYCTILNKKAWPQCNHANSWLSRNSLSAIDLWLKYLLSGHLFYNLNKSRFFNKFAALLIV